MQILRDYDLTGLNTFGVKAKGELFAILEKEEDILELFAKEEFKNNEKLFLGGGSNVLFVRDFPGIVVYNKLSGIKITKEDEASVFMRAMSGECWHDLVIFVVDKGFWGLENLSFIPGSVGGAPMQNIGAYGSEVKDVIESVETYNVSTGEKRIFTNKECKFGYRDSIFKNEHKGEYFISAVNFRLSKNSKPNIEYRILKEYLAQKGIKVSTPKDISDAVIAIRKSKLPDPKILGNSGSFFKNIFITEEKLKELRAQYPNIPSFEEDGMVKVPSAWLIEQCGWKGKKIKNAGVHEKQALVLVNHGGATGEEIKNLAEEIIASVYKKFGLKIAPEVNLI